MLCQKLNDGSLNGPAKSYLRRRHIDEQENELGVRCIGIPLLDYTKRACGAISVSGPVERMTDEAIEIVAGTLTSVGKQISRELGYKEL